MRFTQQLASQTFSQRIVWIKRLFYLIILIILSRSIYLQVFQFNKFDKKAEKQHNQTVAVKLQRGAIYDSEDNILAVSIPLKSMFAIPADVDNPKATALLLADLTGVDVNRLENKLTARGSFVWLKRHIMPSLSEKIEKMKIPGIHFLSEYQRFYPGQNRASQLLGFTGVDSVGLEGIEYKYNKFLMGKGDQTRSLNAVLASHMIKPHNGGSLHLTINDQMQFYVEKELKKAVKAMDAISGTVIVMESQTGAIRALAGMPDYNPNFFSKYPRKTFLNRNVGNVYEPGSTFKIITVASALENKIIEKENLFYCEKGSYKIEDRVIHDTHPHGYLNLEKIIQKSSNICAAKIGQKIPKPVFYRMIREFGFGAKTNIDLPGESTGKVYNYQRWSNVDVATMSYGHGISVTPIQLATAINVIATGGYLLQPYVVDHQQTSEGEFINHHSIEPKKIISSDVAEQVKQFMVSVTEKAGTGYLARLKSVTVAGKTGTTRKYDRKKRAYSSKNHIVSFAGFFPAENPLLTILVVIDDPQNKYLGTKGATSVFRRIAEKGLRIFGQKKEVDSFVIKEKMAGESIFSPNKILKNQDAKRIKKKKNGFKGITLREALRKATDENLMIKFKGSGKVTRVNTRVEKDKKEYELFLN